MGDLGNFEGPIAIVRPGRHYKGHTEPERDRRAERKAQRQARKRSRR